MNSDIPWLTDNMLVSEVVRLNAALAVVETIRKADELLIRVFQVGAELDRRGLA